MNHHQHDDAPGVPVDDLAPRGSVRREQTEPTGTTPEGQPARMPGWAVGVGVVALVVFAWAWLSRWLPGKWSIGGCLAAMLLGWASAHRALDTPRRVYGYLCLAAGSGLVVAVHVLGLAHLGALAGAWATLTLFAGAGFSWTRGPDHLYDEPDEAFPPVPGAVRLPSPWAALAKDQPTLAGTICREIVANRPDTDDDTLRSDELDPLRLGYRFRLSWPPGSRLVREMFSQTDLIESLLDAPLGSVAIENDRDSSTSVWVVVTPPAHATAMLPWDGRPAHSITDQILSARYADGTSEIVRRWTPGVGGFHFLRLGMTRSGKTHSMRHAICTFAGVYTGARDVVQWGIDLKHGMGLRPMAPLLDWLVETSAEALVMLETLVRIIGLRASYSADRGWSTWQPDADHPVIIVYVDEIARVTGFQAPIDLSGAALRVATEICNLGAGVGILLDPATQFPSLEAIGSRQLVEQLGYTEAFRLRSPGYGQEFLPGAPIGIEPSSIPSSRNGACYIDARGEFRPLLAFKPDVTDGQMRATVARYAEYAPSLDAISLPATSAVYAARTRWGLSDTAAVIALPSPEGTAAMPSNSPHSPTPPPVAAPWVATTPGGDPAVGSTAAVGAASSWLSGPGPRTTTRDGGGAAATMVLDQPSASDTEPAEGEPSLLECVEAHLAAMTPAEREAAERQRERFLTENRMDGDPDEGERRLRQLLVDSYPEPIAARDAVTATGMPELWIHERMKAGAAQGLLIHAGWGTYVLPIAA